MPRHRTIQPGDTLRKIAKNFYGDAELVRKLADYNGLRSPDLLRVGQAIEVPSRSELEGKAPQGFGAASIELVPPNGFEQITQTFGDILNYLWDDGTLDPRWEAENLARAELPFAIPLSWDYSMSVTRFCCHAKLTGIFPQVFATIEEAGLKGAIKTFGGCYVFRSKRISAKLSTHSWGIAIDLNPGTNPMGAAGDMDPGIVDVFRQFGFKWGGDWPGKDKDPMHFQFCTGY